MKVSEKYRLVMINAIIALAVTIIVNFSYLLLYTLTISEVSRTFFDRLSSVELMNFLAIQVCYFYVVAFILLTVATLKVDLKGDKMLFYKKIIFCSVIGVALYLVTPTLNRDGDFVLTLLSNRILHPSTILKFSLILVVSLLYGKIYELLYQKQKIVYENELLKNENLQNKYNVLVSQINPHFFFNSLNSLTLLVRERSNEKALDYISTLSDTFRYIINNGQVEMTRLEDELKFVESYKSIFELRYEDKLRININVDNNLYDKLIPSLSLQPLIENAVKHNVITKSKPLTIDIESDGKYLIISNDIQVKLTPPDSTGIGLKNLASRFILIAKKEIVITTESNKFIVKLPIT